MYAVNNLTYTCYSMQSYTCIMYLDISVPIVYESQSFACGFKYVQNKFLFFPVLQHVKSAIKILVQFKLVNCPVSSIKCYSEAVSEPLCYHGDL